MGRHEAPAKSAGLIFGHPVHLDLHDLLPSGVLDVRPATSTAHGDDFVAGANQPGDEVTADMPGGADDDHLHRGALSSTSAVIWGGSVQAFGLRPAVKNHTSTSSDGHLFLWLPAEFFYGCQPTVS